MEISIEIFVSLESCIASQKLIVISATNTQKAVAFDDDFYKARGNEALNIATECRKKAGRVSERLFLAKVSKIKRMEEHEDVAINKNVERKGKALWLAFVNK